MHFKISLNIQDCMYETIDKHFACCHASGTRPYQQKIRRPLSLFTLKSEFSYKAENDGTPFLGGTHDRRIF